jgi:hypothetical protein
LFTLEFAEYCQPKPVTQYRYRYLNKDYAFSPIEIILKCKLATTYRYWHCIKFNPLKMDYCNSSERRWEEGQQTHREGELNTMGTKWAFRPSCPPITTRVKCFLHLLRINSTSTFASRDKAGEADNSTEMEVTEIFWQTSQDFCQLSSHSRGFRSRL